MLWLFTVMFLAVSLTGSVADGRGDERADALKRLFVSVFEWFGELAIFCVRVVRAALLPPYELGELARQCDSAGSKSLGSSKNAVANGTGVSGLSSCCPTSLLS